jgi:hypothetical protein
VDLGRPCAYSSDNFSLTFALVAAFAVRFSTAPMAAQERSEAH